MEIFVKSFATYRTIKQATALAYSLVLDALESVPSTVTVSGLSINRGDTGNWLIIDGYVYQIINVKPQHDRTQLTLGSPLDVFTRPLELILQPLDQTIGGFIAEMMNQHWLNSEDPVYALPYLSVSNSDTAAFIPPDVSNGGVFRLSEYCRLMRKSYRTVVRFRDGGATLRCSISHAGTAARNISFADGRSQLQSVDYSTSGTAKLTVLHDIDTGEKDAEGNKIYTRERTDWYLSESGEVSQLVPSRRASGKWETLYIQGDKDVNAKVVETFARNKANHKLEFWSERDLDVQDTVTFLVNEDLLHSYISYKRKSSDDNRYYYKSGELATTATEKLRGVIK